jgi:hypothetical protein
MQNLAPVRFSVPQFAQVKVAMILRFQSPEIGGART